jgi:hypothetical protein
MEKVSFIDNIFLKRWIPFAIIVALGLVLYFQDFFFNFSYLDDNNLILDNQYFLANLANFLKSFLTDVFLIFNHSAFYYRPLLTISLMFDFQLGGTFPFMYHFTNVVLHILSACLVFTFLKKLDYKKELSFLFSIIFLVHPVLTQTVAWIPGRNDSLLAVFVLSTCIFFIKYLQEEKRSNLVWSLIFFTLALFTKESGICLLPVLFFYLFFIYRKKSKETKLTLNKFNFFFWSIWVVSFWAILRYVTLKDSASLALSEVLKSLYFNFPAVIQFVGKIFFPFNLSVLPIMQDTTFIYGLVSIILLTTMLLLTKTKRWNFILFGFVWFFAFLLPSFIRPNSALVADFIEHRVYVPIIGIFIILLETNFVKNINLKKKSTIIAVSSLILFFSIITFVHSRNFTNKLSFWQNAVQNSPHYPLAHRNLGAIEYLDGNIDEAEKEYKIALELNPNEPMAHSNLGLVYAQQNKLAEAEEEYKKEIEINPNYDNVYYNLGLLYWNEKRYDEAISNWKKTLEINPGYAVDPQIFKILQSIE